MLKLNEKGVVPQVLILIILVAGLGTGIYLTQKTQIFAPKAFDKVSSDSKPTATRAPSQCKSRLTSFQVDQPCDEITNGFKSAQFSCSNEGTKPLQDPIGGEKCRPAAELLSEAIRACRNTCSQISPTPAPSCVPGMIDCPGPPAGCSYIGGTCQSCGKLVCPVPSGTIAPEPIVCIAVITSAKNPKTGECKTFPTLCDVPAGWEKVEKC